jgi:hypothetical protein
LWPPNHKLVEVHATVLVEDECDPNPVFALVSIINSEPDNGTGDGDRPHDIQNTEYGTADVDFSLRSERAGTGDGRTYTITYVATDSSGNETECTAEVLVPHDRVGRANSSDGYSPTGETFMQGHDRFALLIPSGSVDCPEPPCDVVDAASIDLARVYVGNTAGYVEPLEYGLLDVDHDGQIDALLYYDTGRVLAIREASEGTDGPVGLHYYADGFPYLVADIFSLGAPINSPTDTGIDDDYGTLGSPAGTELHIARSPAGGEGAEIAFHLGRSQQVRVDIFDVRGAKVRTLVDAERGKGWTRLTWDGRHQAGHQVSSGVYFVYLATSEDQRTGKLILLK